SPESFERRAEPGVNRGQATDRCMKFTVNTPHVSSRGFISH
ncbi:MAG: hypothetical protein ACI814_003647, partial [Mariniblastus sp.]